ncbi:MAG: DUF5615 family PIN-like protein [Caldilineaceae bacterium]
MRVLLDEQLDRRLKKHVDPEFDVWTVIERGWQGKKNGELLRAAQQEFDVLITIELFLYQMRGSDESIPGMDEAHLLDQKVCGPFPECLAGFSRNNSNEQGN